MSGGYRLPEECRTDRYDVRRALPSDAEEIFEAYASDEQVTRFLGWRPHGSIDDTRAYLDSIQREWEIGTGFPSVILSREAPRRLLGMIHPHCSRQRVNYGYVLRQDAWGFGCATELLHWMVEHALAHPDIYRTEAFCDAEHHASARVMTKAGMTFEGMLRRYFVHPNLSTEPRDCVMYARTR